MADEPIEDVEYIYGPTVVDIEDLRISRGKTRRPKSSCGHVRMAYDPSERRVWCKDCETDVDPFDAFALLVARSHNHKNALDKREARLAEAEQFAIRSLAAKKIDKAWRKKTMIPACPHCQNGLFPEDFKNGMDMLGRDYALARLGRSK